VKLPKQQIEIPTGICLELKKIIECVLKFNSEIVVKKEFNSFLKKKYIKCERELMSNKSDKNRDVD
jgi:hypothetical protein